MRDRTWIGLAGAGALALMALGIWAIVEEQKQWEAFSQAHDCRVVGKIAGHTSYGYYNGKYQTIWVAGKTVYKCNDGVEYTR